jgi:hypothetical protein
VFYIAREIMTSEEVFVDVLKLLNVVSLVFSVVNRASSAKEHCSATAIGKPIPPDRPIGDITPASAPRFPLSHCYYDGTLCPA